MGQYFVPYGGDYLYLIYIPNRFEGTTDVHKSITGVFLEKNFWCCLIHSCYIDTNGQKT